MLQTKIVTIAFSFQEEVRKVKLLTDDANVRNIRI